MRSACAFNDSGNETFMRDSKRPTPRLDPRALALPALRMLLALGHGRGKLPPPWLTHQLARIHWFTARGRRRRLIRDLAEVLDIDDRQVATEILRRSWLASDRSILEVASMYRNPLAPEAVRGYCRVEGMASLRDAQAEGNGVILLTLHAGNAILLAARLALEGLPISVIYRQARKTPDTFFDDCLRYYGVECICAQRRPGRHPDPRRVEAERTLYRTQALMEMRRALRNKRILLIMLDAASKGPGISLPFLGKAITVSPGPEHLARKTGARVVPLWLEAEAPQWQFRIEPPLKLDFAQSPEAVTAQMLAELEQHVHQRPWSWSWHQRRWRSLPFMEVAATGEQAAGG